jgi:serine/threonine protein kinase, bacterial
VQTGATLQIGEEPFPGYRLVRPRGAGGFSQVWEATANDGASIALKFMPGRNINANGQELRAIRALCQLHHPNLIRVQQVWSQAGYLVIAMELADGSLLELLEACQSEYGTAVEPLLLLSYLTQAADALDFLNARRHSYLGLKTGFQHCDVKPSNMLIFGRKLKLADFGLAMPMAVAFSPGPRAGTLDYAATEIFHGQLSDRSDQFALAVTYFQLRTGRFPFPEPPPRFTRTYERPDPDLSPLSPAERPIIERGLASAPSDRWPTCRDLLDRLTALFARPTGNTHHGGATAKHNAYPH